MCVCVGVFFECGWGQEWLPFFYVWKWILIVFVVRYLGAEGSPQSHIALWDKDMLFFNANNIFSKSFFFYLNLLLTCTKHFCATLSCFFYLPVIYIWQKSFNFITKCCKCFYFINISARVDFYFMQLLLHIKQEHLLGDYFNTRVEWQKSFWHQEITWLVKQRQCFLTFFFLRAYCIKASIIIVKVLSQYWCLSIQFHLVTDGNKTFP